MFFHISKILNLSAHYKSKMDIRDILNLYNVHLLLADNQ